MLRIRSAERPDAPLILELVRRLAEYERLVREFPAYKPLLAGSLNDVSWVLATREKPDGAQAVGLAQQAVKLVPADANFWSTLGTAHYRAGEWDAAKTALEKAIEVRQKGTAYEWFFLAMTAHRRDDPMAAREQYDRAVAWTAKEKPDDPELRRFRAETAALLGLPAPK